MRKWLVPFVVGAALLAGAGLWFARSRPVQTVAVSATPSQSVLQGLSAVVYKSPTCGCCASYAEFLSKHGVSVEVVSSDAALAQAKKDYGIPTTAQSCHTVVMDGYVIEGHVPLEALERLLSERPAIDGIALPGMPVGTPGMPGPKQAPFEVLELDEGTSQTFMTL